MSSLAAAAAARSRYVPILVGQALLIMRANVPAPCIATIGLRMGRRDLEAVKDTVYPAR